ncbi:MAG: aminoglycoside phosphotransferase family protein [Anaerolineae bacterium]|nr:aminoglycoside phosphotransferase family protein [Anaerolineae bacterium]
MLSNNMARAHFGQLIDLEETMTSIAAYLLVAHTQHPKYILGKPDEGALEVRANTIKMRVTQHYTAALLTYGFTTDTPELQWATEWFASPFPRAEHDVIDAMEMIKLEGLLNLRPDDPMIQPRLQQLLRQKNEHFFEIDRADDQDNPTPIFDTLWALKVILLARQKGVLNQLLDDTTLKNTINRIIDIAIYDKDIALALHLYYELNGKLEKNHVTILERLIKRSLDHRYIWGINRADTWDRVKDIVEAMHKRQLTPGVIDSQGDAFREVILNLCYVVENLAILSGDYPEVAKVVQHSMELWWKQFYGDLAPLNLRTLFPKDYDYLMVMCRTLVAVGAFVGEPLSARCWLPSLRKMAKDFGNHEWAEKENIKQAMRQWIGIDLGEPELLKLGLSEANVVRLRPTIFNPMDEGKEDLLGASLIVKYGPLSQIEAERQNYNKLTTRHRTMFVNLPDASYIDDSTQRGFVIMQDLNNYQTLFEIYDRLLKPDNPRIGGLLSDFLIAVHTGDHEAPMLSSTNHLRELYLLPMLQHVDYISAQLQNDDLYTDEFIDDFHQIETKLNAQLAGIMQHQARLGRFPLSYMHGDLHSRNIMIRLIQREGVSRGSANYDFKLIDLESLRDDGDAAHDAGQLLIDLNLLHITGKKNVNRSVYTKLANMQKEIAQAYLLFAEERGDTAFTQRLDLGKARAVIRIAKGRTKRGEQHRQKREYQQAIDTIADVLNLLEEANEHLKSVYDQIC